MGIRTGRNFKNMAPFYEFHTHSVPLIPYSAIAKTILDQSPFFTVLELRRVLALQVNDTKDKDRVIYIDSIDSLYTNITG